MSPSDMSFTANTYYNYRDCIQKHIISRIGGLRLLALNQGHLMKMYKEPVKQYSAISIARPENNAKKAVLQSANCKEQI